MYKRIEMSEMDCKEWKLPIPVSENLFSIALIVTENCKIYAIAQINEKDGLERNVYMKNINGVWLYDYTDEWIRDENNGWTNGTIHYNGQPDQPYQFKEA